MAQWMEAEKESLKAGFRDFKLAYIFWYLLGVFIGWSIWGYAPQHNDFADKCHAIGGYPLDNKCWALMEPIEIK